jgi:hypothetical protein
MHEYQANALPYDIFDIMGLVTRKFMVMQRPILQHPAYTQF